MALYVNTALLYFMCGSRGGGGGGGTGGPDPLENHKIYFFSKTGPDPLKIVKLPSQHSMLARQRNDI